MFKRILFIIYFTVSLPLFFVAYFLLPIMGLICLFIYIINGDKNDVLIDWIIAPYIFVMNLPYVLIGEDKFSLKEMCGLDE